MSDVQQFSFSLEQQDAFAFLVRFDNEIPSLLTDEPPPLGGNAGPNPSRLIAAGVANCLCASLLFALKKFKNDPGKVTGTVTARLGRNQEKRLRIEGMTVEIQFAAAADALANVDRVLEQFEDFCVVTQSVRSGFPVDVIVRDGAGRVLKGAEG
jgi:organic hydroperoxide reductase OsmC/OhrA